jgi:DNA (cytosine-5)-methyltransferase 1
MTAAAMKALDLFCSAGGATRGLMQAGFAVTGVDLRPQPRYCGDVFVLADAVAYLSNADLSQFDFVWSSPPCQKFTAVRRAPGAKGDAHPDLIGPTRELLVKSRMSYVIENVEGAPLVNPVTLCGTMFGLCTPDGAELRRHRLFETSFPLLTPSCQHGRGPVIGVYGAHVRNRRRPSGTNHKSGSNRPWEHAFVAIGVPVGSMTLAELSEAIPPTYSQFVVEAFLSQAQPKRFTHLPGIDRVERRSVNNPSISSPAMS